MGKRSKGGSSEPQGASGGGVPGYGWALIAAMGVLAIAGLSVWNRGNAAHEALSTRLASLENKVDQVQKELQTVKAQAQAQPQPPRRGVDPNKVHTVKVDGAPVKGPGGAAVTIVEVSDFQ